MGTSILLVFIILPATLIFLFAAANSGRKVFYRVAAIPLLLFGALLLYVNIYKWGHRLQQREVYGEYIIDRSKFPGKQANWQYRHFRMSIDRQDTLRLFVVEQGVVQKVYARKIKFVPQRVQALWTFDEEHSIDTHHIIASTPTLYRKGWDFYYVFESSAFHNVFFKKGKWRH